MKPTRFHSCNVLHVGPVSSDLWQFDFSGNQVAKGAEQTHPTNAPLPAKLVRKDWRGLFQPRLNLAWLPADQVFLRVVQLPTSDAAEVPAMIEFQLEKISPLPVAQIVWSYELLPPTAEKQRTAIVVIIARNHVERFLGQLETQGFLPDHLDLSILHQLAATKFNEDGAWVFPGSAAGKHYCLVAWHYGGALQNLSLIHVPVVETLLTVLEKELTQMTWAGEVEGWLTAAPRLHLVADAAAAALWEPALRQITSEPVMVQPALPPPEIAALNAKRIARAETRVNLLPPEYAARYQQQFIDGLWMRGLFSLGVAYLACVAIYFAWLQVLKFQTGRVEQKVAVINSSFTNALQLKARIQVMQEQSNLRYAALDCWKTIIESMPAGVTLTQMGLTRGTNLNLLGFAEDATKVTDYTEALTKARVKEKPLFGKVNLRNSQLRPGPGGAQSVQWNIDCEVQRLYGP